MPCLLLHEITSQSRFKPFKTLVAIQMRLTFLDEMKLSRLGTLLYLRGWWLGPITIMGTRARNKYLLALQKKKKTIVDTHSRNFTSLLSNEFTLIFIHDCGMRMHVSKIQSHCYRGYICNTQPFQILRTT